MPSTHQHAQRQRWEPSDVDGFDEDPARFLDCGEALAIARIRGIEDIDLLRAYQSIEADRQRRGTVMGAIGRRLTTLRENE